MATGLLEIMKMATMQVNENAQLSDFTFGKVIGISPLKIQINAEFILTSEFLIVPQHLTDYEIEVSLKSGYGWITEDTQHGSKLQSLGLAQNHKHDIKQDKKKVFIHNALKTGDKVALLRQSGGQSYFILDRV